MSAVGATVRPLRPSERDQAARYVDLVLGSGKLPEPRWAAVFVGHEGFFTTTGKYDFKRVEERFYRWPEQRDRLLDEALEVAPEADVYIAPMLRTALKRRKATGAGGHVLWVDVDEEWTETRLATWERIVADGGGLVVSSGRNTHGYVLLDRVLEAEEVEERNRRLRELVDGDDKWSNESLLRLPGPMNHKGRARGEASYPVRLHPPAATPLSVERFDELVPATASSTAPAKTSAAKREAEPERAKVRREQLPRFLRDKIDEAPGKDRSGQTWDLLASCVEHGLDDDDARFYAARHSPTIQKYEGRDADLVDKALGKLRPQHDHVGADCLDAGCPNRPEWMKPQPPDPPHPAEREDDVTSPKLEEVSGNPDTERSTKLEERSAPVRPDEPSSWAPVDLEPVVNGNLDRPAPTILRRSDGRFLLYAGRVHFLYGPSESMKTWVALLAAVEVVIAGGIVVFVDFEGDRAEVVGRLVVLGLTGARCSPRSATSSLTSPSCAARPAPTSSGSSTSARSSSSSTPPRRLWNVHNRKIGDNDDATPMGGLLKGMARRAGAAVVLIDHVPHNPREGGSTAPIGAQMKKAMTTGAMYEVVVKEALAPGQVGVVELVIEKDRAGGVPEHSPFRHGKRFVAARVTLDAATHAGVVLGAVEDVSTADRKPSDALRTRMVKVAELLVVAGDNGMSKRQVREHITGKADLTDDALAALVDGGWVERRPGPRNALVHVLLKPYEDASAVPTPTLVEPQQTFTGGVI